MMLRIAFLFAFGLAASTAWCAPKGDAALLAPEAAFTASASLVEPALIEIRYRIAEGHYLYREKFKFSLAEASPRVERAELPQGIPHRDEFFGSVEIYRGELAVHLPLTGDLGGRATLKAVSQGCADAGICYPPQTHILAVGTGAAAQRSAAPARKSADLLARLTQAAVPASTGAEFLPVEQAFRIQARMPDAQTVVVRFSPAESYYLYRDKTRFAISGSESTKIETVQLPRGEMKKDPNFGDTEVFHQAFQAVIRIRQSSATPSPFTLEVGYQGCSEKGLCYPPEKRIFSLAFGANPAAGSASTPAPVAPGEAGAGDAQADDQRVARLLGSGNFWLIIVSFLGFGLLLSLTPCMWPMIPILSGIIAGQGGNLTRSRGFVLSATYVLGLALAYAAAGIGAGLSGSLLSNALQNAWVLTGFALVFVALSLSMFGLYELQLPASLQSRLSATSGRLKGGTFFGVFLMGALSAVIVGPCVAAPLAGALLYISQSRDTVLGGSALFAMAIGMGLPLLAIGTSAGALLPRSGPWMQWVKNVFGVLLLATAVWIVSPVIPVVAQMLLWAALLVVCAVYLRALDRLPSEASGWRKLSKGLGVLALLLGIAMLVGVLTGGRDVLRPLSGLREGSIPQTPAHAAFTRITSVAQLDAAVVAAKRPVMLDFYADWCVSCKEMERFTFSDNGVGVRLNRMLLLQADVTANSADDKALLARFGLFGPPGIIFFDRDGNELRNNRVIGYQPADRFRSVLDQVLAP